MSWHTNAPIHIKLAHVAIWNALTRRRVIDLRDPTLGFLKSVAPAIFNDLIEAPRPVAMGDVK